MVGRPYSYVFGISRETSIQLIYQGTWNQSLDQWVSVYMYIDSWRMSAYRAVALFQPMQWGSGYMSCSPRWLAFTMSTQLMLLMRREEFLSQSNI